MPSKLTPMRPSLLTSPRSPVARRTPRGIPCSVSGSRAQWQAAWPAASPSASSSTTRRRHSRGWRCIRARAVRLVEAPATISGNDACSGAASTGLRLPRQRVDQLFICRGQRRKIAERHHPAKIRHEVVAVYRRPGRLVAFCRHRRARCRSRNRIPDADLQRHRRLARQRLAVEQCLRLHRAGTIDFRDRRNPAGCRP